MKPVELQSPDPYLRFSVSWRCHLGSCQSPARDPQPERHEIDCRKCRDGRPGAPLSFLSPLAALQRGSPGEAQEGRGCRCPAKSPPPPSRLTGSS